MYDGKEDFKDEIYQRFESDPFPYMRQDDQIVDECPKTNSDKSLFVCFFKECLKAFSTVTSIIVYLRELIIMFRNTTSKCI